jgi:MAF protein
LIELILASHSPRRRELLALAGIPFQTTVADVDEATIVLSDPAENSRQTALMKARAVAARCPGANPNRQLILAADTNVALDDTVLGKPKNGIDAQRMLQALRGREHTVNTGMALIDLHSRQEVTAVHTAAVTMRSYSNNEIERYVASGDPLDKAGAYGIQNRQFRPVASLSGCYLGVMGISICQLLQVLSRLDVPLRADRRLLKTAHHHFWCPLLDEIGKEA